MKWYTEDSGAERGRDRENEHREARNGGEDGMKIEFQRPSVCVCVSIGHEKNSLWAGSACLAGMPVVRKGRMWKLAREHDIERDIPK